jgi:phosphatidylserine/phosphatidylglycerophosphate/cardiolipin synthase-like enzyme
MEGLRRLSRPAMLALAEALANGRVGPRPDASQLGGVVPDSEVRAVRQDLIALAEAGVVAPMVARMLGALAAERAAAQAVADCYELVWSGDEGPAETRSTAVVVQELFLQARRSLMVASYALERGYGSTLFAGLARRMDELPDLAVRFYVNVERRHQDPRADHVLLDEFVDAFRQKTWPGKRLPEVYYDPRAMVLGGQRACLHAKCVVIDDEVAFVTSANFTEAAQDRNIEAGVLMRDPRSARSLTGQFASLVSLRKLLRVPGL